MNRTYTQEKGCVQQVAQCLLVAVHFDHLVLDEIERVANVLYAGDFAVEDVMRINQLGVHFLAALGNKLDGRIDELGIFGVQLLPEYQRALQLFAMLFQCKCGQYVASIIVYNTQLLIKIDKC